MLPAVPAPLAAIFEKQVTISAAELCRLLPMSPDLLRAHVGHGHIDYVELGIGDRAPRRSFTLDQVMRFITGRSFREVLYPLRSSRKAVVQAEPIDENSFTFRRAVRREAEAADGRRAYRNAVAELGHSSKLLPPLVGLSQSPLAFAARKRIREEAKALKEKESAAAAAARQAKKDNRPPKHEDAISWKKRLAAERALRVAERRKP